MSSISGPTRTQTIKSQRHTKDLNPEPFHSSPRESDQVTCFTGRLHVWKSSARVLKTCSCKRTTAETRMGTGTNTSLNGARARARQSISLYFRDLVTFWSSEAGDGPGIKSVPPRPFILFYGTLEPFSESEGLKWALDLQKCFCKRWARHGCNIHLSFCSVCVCVCVSLSLLQGKRNKPGVEAASSPDSVRGRGENKAIK